MHWSIGINSGRVIYLNGASSSGKTTIARGLQESLDEPYMHLTVDGYLHQLPGKYLADGEYLSGALPALLEGFNPSCCISG